MPGQKRRFGDTSEGFNGARCDANRENNSKADEYWSGSRWQNS